jgi:hypothetical protein
MIAPLAPKAPNLCPGKRVGQQADGSILKYVPNYVLIGDDVGQVGDKTGTYLQVGGSRERGRCANGGNLKYPNSKVQYGWQPPNINQPLKLEFKLVNYNEHMCDTDICT